MPAERKVVLGGFYKKLALYYEKFMNLMLILKKFSKKP